MRGVLVCIVALLLSSCADRTETDVAAPAPALDALLPVEAGRVRIEQGYTVRASYAGRVVARRASQLGFERGGRLDAVLVDEGDRVEAGALLARLDTRELEARRRELAAQVEETRARLELAGLTAERRAQLLANQSISPQRRDEARYDEMALNARLAAARAAIESVEVSLDLSQLVAPYAGSITARDADEGSVVSPGQPILRIIEDRVLEVRVGLPPETAVALDRERTYPIALGQETYAARVRAVLDTVETDTRTVTAVFEFDTAPTGVRSGTLARVEVETEMEARGFWVPLGALSEGRRGLWTVYAVVPNGAPEAEALRVERRELQVLHADSQRAFVRGTLQDGDRVVVTGIHRLVPGQRVRLAP